MHFREEPVTPVYRHWIVRTGRCNGELLSTGESITRLSTSWKHRCGHRAWNGPAVWTLPWGSWQRMGPYHTQPCCAAGFQSGLCLLRVQMSRLRGQASRYDWFSGAVKGRASSIRVIRSDGVNGEVSDPRVSGIRPIFVAALAAAMLPACTQSCDALSSGQQFPTATDLFAHPMSIYWRDRLFSKMHYPSSHAGSPIATRQQTS
jgi:hypothetical protein